MKESFAPQIVVRIPVDPISPRSKMREVTVTPESWMWVLGFAFAGVEWAVRKAIDPEFDMDTKIRRYELRRRLYFRQEHLEALEVRVKKARAEIEQIARDLHILERER